MSKYSFERIGSEKFEQLAQALLEKNFRVGGRLIQFGSGKDGAREATWIQPANHPLYTRPVNEIEDTPKNWVFQAKYHDIGTRGWAGARAEIESELGEELEKIVVKYKVPCHKYIMITNVPFSGIRHVGTRDKVEAVIDIWKTEVPEIEVWDATDLSRMLDADPETRTTYLDDVLPGDVLRSLMKSIDYGFERRTSAFHAYLKSLLRSEREAKAEEAGDESGLNLESIFVDLDVKLVADPVNDSPARRAQKASYLLLDKRSENLKFKSRLPASFAFLIANHESMFLKGGPGVGKSTITQFLALYHAARLVEPSLSEKLIKRLKLPSSISGDKIDAYIRIRVPFRIELRRYAQWINALNRVAGNECIAQYLAEQVNHASSSALSLDDIYALVNNSSVLLILDGLDEVPNPDIRKRIFEELTKFRDRCEGEACDLQVLLSSRPQGYRGEFGQFRPVEWRVLELKQDDFYNYANQWIDARIQNLDERADAIARIREGMQSQIVQQLATTLLQATVMLTIVRRKQTVPHARRQLYAKYVEVIFDRERIKDTVRKHSHALMKLHELVAFQLIRRMESGQTACTLQAGEFKLHVFQVIEDYEPADLGGNSIAEVVKEIVSQAKDRLCLLAGKGDNQDEVDFAIHQFREFFAAAYLSSHENADPDRVYSSLSSRSNVWSQVLQFYAGFVSQSIQKNWISEIDELFVFDESFESIVSMTRKRRGLLRLIPEFERPKNEYISRLVQSLFAKSTRWTWNYRENLIAVLKGFVPDDLFLLLRKLFCSIPGDDPATLFVELDLLAKASSAGSTHESDFVELVNSWVNKARFSRICLKVAAANNVTLDLTACRLEPIESVLSNTEQTETFGNEFLSSLTEGQILDLIFKPFTEYLVWLPISKYKNGLFGSIWSCISNARTPPKLDDIKLKLPAFFEDRRTLVTGEMVDFAQQSQSKCGRYIAALLRGIMNPTDHSSYLEAASDFSVTGRSFSLDLAVVRQLGPSPSDYESIEVWASARTKTFKFAENGLKEWLSFVSTIPNGWFSLFVHPDAWPLLEPITPKFALTTLVEKYQFLLKGISPKSALPVEIIDYSPSQNVRCLDFLNTILAILKSHGVHALHVPYLLPHYLSNSNLSDYDVVSADRLLLLGLELNENLPRSIAGLIIRTTSTVSGVSVELLNSLWQRHASSDFSVFASIVPPAESVVCEIIENPHRYDVRLAAFMSAFAEQQEPVVNEQLGKRVTQSLCKIVLGRTHDDVRTNIQLLLHQAVDSCEIDIWCDPSLVKLVRNDAWYVLRIAARIGELVRYVAERDRATLREKLGAIIERRLHFPMEIANAAVDAIILIDELSCGPLEDKVWQRINL